MAAPLASPSKLAKRRSDGYHLCLDETSMKRARVEQIHELSVCLGGVQALSEDLTFVAAPQQPCSPQLCEFSSLSASHAAPLQTPSCGCNGSTTCVDSIPAYLEQLSREHACELKGNIASYSSSQKEAPLFHVSPLPKESKEFSDIAAEFASENKAFEVLAVLRISHEFNEALFATQCDILKARRGDANVRTMYHCTKGNHFDILQTNLNPAMAQEGFFGRALYFSSEPFKANDYSPARGTEKALRSMLRCQVALGKTCEYGLGTFDRSLKTAPSGYDSVSGFIRRADEYAVYSSTHVLVSSIVIYRCIDVAKELALPLNVPARVTGEIVFLTLSLSEFFSKLQKLATDAEQKERVRAAIGSLLRSQCDTKTFLTRVSAIFKSNPPSNLGEKLDLELAKCKLANASAKQASGTTSGNNIAIMQQQHV